MFDEEPDGDGDGDVGAGGGEGVSVACFSTRRRSSSPPSAALLCRADLHLLRPASQRKSIQTLLVEPLCWARIAISPAQAPHEYKSSPALRTRGFFPNSHLPP